APTQSAMNEPRTAPPLARCVWHDFLRARHALFIFEVLFKLAQVWLFAPAVALLVAAVLAGAGHIAVSNRDILDFLLTPAGLCYAALFGTIAVGLLLFEQASIMVLAALTGPVERPPVKAVLRTAVRKSLHVVQLAAVMAVLLALAFLPFVLLAA